MHFRNFLLFAFVFSAFGQYGKHIFGPLLQWAKKQLYLQVHFGKGDSNELTEFESWINRQKEISFASILNNIGGISNDLPDFVSNGAVIASPSKKDPDYFYQWTRDGALCVRSLILEIGDKKLVGVDNLRQSVEAYIENQYYIQRIDNLSGDWNRADKASLGEPKFLADNSPFNKKWGRPQHDGPGLRAATISIYVNLLDKHELPVKNNFLNNTRDIYESIIKPDLIYVVQNWNKVGFDLWEEVNSHHFFTSITHLRAVLDGVSIAKKYNESQQFINQLQDVSTKLKDFITNKSGFISDYPYILETPDLVISKKRVGLDVATLLGSIHSHPLSYNYDVDYNSIPYNTNSSLLLNTLHYMIADMRYRYPINRATLESKLSGTALGRYPEDVYDGHGFSLGNPWFISTATAAEVLFRFIYQLNVNENDVALSEKNSPFFDVFIELSQDNDDLIKYGSGEFKSLINNMFNYADSFLKIIREHSADNGHISEQFNRVHGFMQGAEQLTWSHSALWNALRWRDFAKTFIN